MADSRLKALKRATFKEAAEALNREARTIEDSYRSFGNVSRYDVAAGLRTLADEMAERFVMEKGEFGSLVR